MATAEDNYMSQLTKLQLPSPNRLGRVGDKGLRKVALDTTDHVVMLCLSTLANDTKGMVFHDRGAADAAQQTLLHPALELEDCDLGRWNLDIDGNLTEGNPWNENKDCHEDSEPELLRANKCMGVVSPFSALDVVDVAHDDEHPCCLLEVSIVFVKDPWRDAYC